MEIYSEFLNLLVGLVSISSQGLSVRPPFRLGTATAGALQVFPLLVDVSKSIAGAPASMPLM